MCDKFVFKDHFMSIYSLNRCKTEEMCDDPVQYFILLLTFVHDWFVKNNMLESLNDALFSTYYIDLDNILPSLATIWGLTL